MSNIDQLMIKTADAHVSDSDSSINVNKVNKFDLMEEAYKGTGGFRDGNYLVPHERERSYERRKRLAFYRNFIQPIVNALITPVFSDKVDYDIEGTYNFTEDFTEDCDRLENCLQDKIEKACLLSVLHGVSFIVVDNFNIEMEQLTIQNAKDLRIFPYIYIKKIQEVYNITYDEIGKTQSIAFYADTYIDENRKEFKQIRVWRENTVTLLREDKNGEYTEIVSIINHNLGIIPVVTVQFSKEDKIDNIEPPLYDIVKVNLAIFNKDSEIRTLERSQGFSQFYIQSDAIGDMTVSDQNVLFIPNDCSIPPGYASPDAGILAQLTTNNEKLKESLFELAEQKGVSIVPAKSGISQQWDFRGQEEILKYVSSMASYATQKVFTIFNLYTKEQVEITCNYPQDFAPQDSSKEVNDITKTMTDLSFPPLATSVLKEKVFKMLAWDQSEDSVESAIEEIRAEGIDNGMNDGTNDSTEDIVDNEDTVDDTKEIVDNGEQSD